MTTRTDKHWRWTALAPWVVGALVVAAALSYRPFSAASGSMAPTLLTGDWFFVNKAAYGVGPHMLPFGPHPGAKLFGRTPARGDVIVFVSPRDKRTEYVKRVVGLPGDTIQLKGGRLVVNGVVVDRQPLAPVTLDDPVSPSGPAPAWRESLPGGAGHTIIELEGDQGMLDDAGPFAVPAGQVFVLGDNRDNSVDSRQPTAQGGLGFIPLDHVIGRASFIHFSLAPGGAVGFWGRVRRDRLFTAVR